MADNVKHKIVIQEKGFKYWLTNVFLFHYRAHIIVGLLVVALILFLIFSARDVDEPEFRLAIITSGPAFTQQGHLIDELASLRGLNTQTSVLVTGGPDHIVYMQIMIVGVNHDYVLMFLGESSLDMFGGQEDAFFNMAELGFVATEENPTLLDISGAELTHALGLTGEPLFAMIRRPVLQRDGTISPQNARRAERAAEFLRIFIEYPAGFEEFLQEQ